MIFSPLTLTFHPSGELGLEPGEVSSLKEVGGIAGGAEDPSLSPDKNPDGLTEKKRKPRLRIGVGVGGFIARPRIRSHLYKQQRTMIGPVRGGIAGLPPQIMKSPPGADANEDDELGASGDKKLRRKRVQHRKKSELEDLYPAYLQV